MNELEKILRQHTARYPLMEPTDAVKLIYQNEFAGGHLIRDEDGCRAYLRREFAATPRNPSIPMWEDIGNGILRIHLAAIEETAWLEEAFLRSAREHRGSMDSFLEKLEALRSLTRAGALPFSPADLDAYLREYRALGFPPVSHSPVYREHYHPAYRVILAGYCPGYVISGSGQ